MYERCCGRFHAGDLPESAEELMRSRYAAYARGLCEYVIATTDPEGPRWWEDLAAWRSELEGFVGGTRFLGLKVLGTGALDGGERESGEQESAELVGGAWVEFEARLSSDEGPSTLRERSRFVRRDGRWLYHDGTHH